MLKFQDARGDTRPDVTAALSARGVLSFSSRVPMSLDSSLKFDVNQHGAVISPLMRGRVWDGHRWVMNDPL